MARRSARHCTRPYRSPAHILSTTCNIEWNVMSYSLDCTKGGSNLFADTFEPLYGYPRSVVFFAIFWQIFGFLSRSSFYLRSFFSEMWSNAKIQKLQIFSFYELDSFISECSIWSREFWSISDVRFNLEISVFPRWSSRLRFLRK